MTPIAHSVVGFLGWQNFAEKKTPAYLVLFILIANIPDIDFLFYFVLGEKLVGLHQYYTHNVFFVALAAAITWPWLKTQKERLGLTLVAFSHLLMDFFTIDAVPPIGFRLFFPFSRKLFNLGIFPNILKSNWAEVFSLHNLLTLGFEIVFFVMPVTLVYRKELAGYLKIEQWNK